MTYWLFLLSMTVRQRKEAEGRGLGRPRGVSLHAGALRIFGRPSAAPRGAAVGRLCRLPRRPQQEGQRLQLRRRRHRGGHRRRQCRERRRGRRRGGRGERSVRGGINDFGEALIKIA